MGCFKNVFKKDKAMFKFFLFLTKSHLINEIKESQKMTNYFLGKFLEQKVSNSKKKLAKLSALLSGSTYRQTCKSP
jgi:hypothetical protein